MASARIGVISDQFRRIFGGESVSGSDEAELLRRFAIRREPAALEALVNRYGPMVMGVCRRVLGNTHDADDAFQATFLVLARRAGSIRDASRLGGWLHGVAQRVAVRARADGARRKHRERPGTEEVAMATSSGDREEYDRAELRSTLDEEIHRLPEKFRAPVILCYLDGLTHDEAALRLRCPVGTVRSRLSTGRARLRERLARRGVAVPAGVFAAVLSSEAASAAVPSILVDSTVQAAITFAASGAGGALAGVVSTGAVSLAEGVTTTMTMAKWKLIGGLAVAGILSLGIGGAAAQRFVPGAFAGEAAAVALADDTAEDSLDDLHKQVEAAARERDELKRSLEEARAELARLRAELDRANKGEAAPSAGGGAQLGRLAGAGAGGGSLELGTTSQAGGGMGPGAKAGSAARAAAGGGQLVGPEGGAAAAGGGTGVAVDASAPFAGAGTSATGDLASVIGAGAPVPQPQGRMMAGMMPQGLPGHAGNMHPGTMGDMMMQGMMRGGRMGGPPAGIPALQTEQVYVVHRPDSNRVAAYSTETGKWSPYEVPKGIVVSPVAANGTVALAEAGDAIGEIAVYSAQHGDWYPYALKENVDGKVFPMVSNNVAVYSIGRRVYAFSAEARTWGVLELGKDANPEPTLWSRGAKVEHGDRLYLFSSKTGEWTGFDTKSGAVIGPNAE